MNKLILVSNRLPISISGEGENLKIKPSDGGLASAVGRVSKKLQARWIGYLGDQPSDETLQSVRKLNFFPVTIPAKTYRRYYSNYSNRVLWPILHGLAPFASPKSYWADYVAANQAFADEVARIAGPDDAIWVHDYQLFLLPELLRRRGLTNKIGFFLHTPFPDKSFFSDTKAGRRILRSLMLTDSLGVQTNRHLEKLRNAVMSAGAMVSRSSQLITYHNRFIKTGAFPIGIDYRYFSRRADRNMAFMERIRPKAESRIILSLSRLDYTKGIPELLKGVDLMTKNQNLYGKFVLRLKVIPSRETQTEYQKLKAEIEQLVEEINKSVGAGSWRPVEYTYGVLAPDELLSTYRQADIFVAASLADGMNLVAKEYLAANARGTLVLSRETGASEQLQEALLVDAGSPISIAEVISKAIISSPPRQSVRRLRKIVRTENVFTWAETFLGTL
jgi:trehalose 6-phosphate synthase/phosphatase